MILILDAISPIPKFVLIDNNKIIESLHILDQNSNKLSSKIHSKFLILKKKHKIFEKLNKLITFTGPGSYTSLRVGISFMLGISYSKNISISAVDYAKYLSKNIVSENFYSTFIIICSMNNQNFICIPLKYKNYQYKTYKISDKYFLNKIDLNLYTHCVSNFQIPDFIKNEIFSIKKIIFSNLENKIYKSFKYLPANKNVIKPIYISDNKLFD